jgi:nucleotide-binding universal stress UspA family protein
VVSLSPTLGTVKHFQVACWPVHRQLPRRTGSDSRKPPEEFAMRKVLVPVDGSAAAHHAVRHIIALTGTCPSIEVVLLNVQPEIDDWSVRRLLKKEEVEAMEECRGGDTLQQYREVLDAAGVRFTPLVEIGPAAEIIARVAREQGCDGIVMGSRGLGAVSSVLLGSVSSRVLEITDLPVTLLK